MIALLVRSGSGDNMVASWSDDAFNVTDGNSKAPNIQECREYYSQVSSMVTYITDTPVYGYSWYYYKVSSIGMYSCYSTEWRL